MVQWLGLHALTAEGPGSTPGCGLRPHKPHGSAPKRNRKFITFSYYCFAKNNRMTQVASPGNKYFNFCFIFMMTNNFQVYFLFLNTKLNHKQVQPRHFISHLHTPIGSSSNLLTTDQASVGLVGGGGHGRGKTSLGSTVMRLGLGGIEVEDRFSCLSPFTFTWESGGGVGLRQRPQIAALEPQAPELQVDRKWESVPPSGRSYPLLLLSQSR